MSTNELTLVSEELEDAVHHAKVCKAMYQNLCHRIQKQRQTVAIESERLEALVNERAWEQADTTEAAKDARRDCFEATECYQEEVRLLEAIVTAASNAKAEANSANRKVYGVIGGIVTSQLGGDDLRSLIDGEIVIGNTLVA